jgi:DNA-binding NtrC family response regulator
VELIASRFFPTANGVVDMATGEHVTLRRLPACEAGDARRWSAACASLAALWHEDMPSLLDYGYDSHERFEAYELRAVGPKHSEAPAAVRAFLSEAGIGASPEPRSSQDAADPPRLGLRLLARHALGILQEILEDGGSGRSRSVICAGERGSGVTTLMRAAAAEGRRRGYVAVAARALNRWPQLAPLLRDRHVLLLSDTDAGETHAHQWFLRLARSGPAAHVLLKAGEPGPGQADAVLRLDGFDPDALVGSLSQYPPRALSERCVRQAALRSGGLPGPFLRALRATRRFRAALREAPAARPIRVAEARATYAPDQATSPPMIDHPWSDMLAHAAGLTARGRHAAAERELREIAAAAGRRHMAAPAVAASLRLAWMLLARGRLEAAEALFCSLEPARPDEDPEPLERALGVAAVKIERGSFEAAESILRAARGLHPAAASLALGECLAWQARYDEAERCLASIPQSADVITRAVGDVVLARVALGREDLPRAARLASSALAVLHSTPRQAAVANAHEILAMVHGAVADRPAVERHGVAAMAAARRGRVIVKLPRLRASIAEALHACGVPPSRRGLDRLLAFTPRMTPLSSACVWRMAARIHPVAREREASANRLTSFVTATGAAALDHRSNQARDNLVEGIARLVHLQETATDTRGLLRGIAEQTAARLGARAVHLVCADGTRVGCAGPSDPIDAAAHVLRTRMTLPPWGNGGGLEAGAPARVGGRMVGAVAVRWPAAHTPDREAIAMIAAAAAFAAPALANLADPPLARQAGADADGMVGRSAAIERVRDAVARAAPTPFPVLVEGESGSGKELVARAIHAGSSRRHRSCVAVNCAALGDDLLEAELFGHARGAFTGAHADRPGLFEQADGGTLFLDEVSELSPRAQAKLLRALQDGEVRRVGENAIRRVDVRVVAASNRRLEDDVAQGRFRRDLLFRLAVVRIAVPPLRDRRADIPLLVAHYWRRAAERTGSRATLTAAAAAVLAAYDWPGNVRELQNVLAALAVHAPRGRIAADTVRALVRDPGARDSTNDGTLVEARRRFDREYVAATLARCGGRQARAARELGLTRQGLAKLLRRLSTGAGP